MLSLICFCVYSQSLEQCMGNIRHSKLAEFKDIYCFFFFYPHCTDEETEIHRGQTLVQAAGNL